MVIFMAEKRKDNKGRNLKDGENQMPDGRYRYQYMSNGKRYTIYSWRLVATDKTPPGKRESRCLREMIEDIKADLKDGIDGKKAAKLTLNAVYKLYMSGKHDLKQSTRTNYNYMYTHYIADGLGLKKISDIKYSDIRTFYGDLIQKKNFKPNSMEIINTILHPTFALAVRDGYIRANPTDGIMSEIKKSYGWEKPKRHALTIEEQEAFMSYIANSKTYNRWLPLFTVFLGTGCRVGEVIGLRWSDCDFERGMISINHNLVYRQQDNGMCEMHITTPKTAAGCRYVPMMAEVKSALLQERKRQMKQGGILKMIDGYMGFVFTNRNGSVHNPQTLNAVIKRIYTAYNKQEAEKAILENREPVLIRHFSVHNLRHTFCTRLCEKETNVKVIQDIMGHSDIGTTLNVYAEVTERKKKESFADLEGKIKIS